jgi:hypothetical protein
MRFLVRMAFWLGLVVLLLPAAPSQETAPARQIGGTVTLLPEEAEPSPRPPSRDTLTLADVAVPWRGPPSRMDTGSQSSR